jgi:pantetheine-phosphate adenylyltransferase
LTWFSLTHRSRHRGRQSPWFGHVHCFAHTAWSITRRPLRWTQRKPHKQGIASKNPPVRVKCIIICWNHCFEVKLSDVLAAFLILYIHRFIRMSQTAHLAVYPGTFDPMTLGHLDLVRRACRLFPELVVGVAAGHHKKTLFSLQDRLEMAQRATAEYGNVRVVPFDSLLRDFVIQMKGQVVVRGLRAVSDFEYEFQMAGMNRQLMPDVETVFLTPSDQFQFVSGTFVREIALLGGDVSKFVNQDVLQRLQRRAESRKTG